MLNMIVEALRQRSDLAGWTVRHVQTHEAQVYAVPQSIESQRAVEGEKYLIDVLRNTTASDGSPAVGSGDASLLPGDDVERAIEQAALVAGLVANPVYGLPEPSPFPEVPLSDEELQKDASAVMLAVMQRIRDAAVKNPEVRLTAAECFGEVQSTHLVNSRGFDARQESTRIDIEFVLHGKQGERESETFEALTRRRVDDLDVESAITDGARHTLDALAAGAPASWQGPVVLRHEALKVFLAGDSLNGGVIHTLASAAAKYAKFSPWEIGKPVFRGAVQGDSLTAWANRAMPFGIASDRFDMEGLPAQRVQLIRENELVAFAAGQRYAEYLGLRPTGAFGGLELPPGKMPASELTAQPHVEIVQFSWFNPNRVTGDFATEIRFGYLVEDGMRKPFKGGQLVGNYMDALANVHWSIETGFFGSYLGPHTARFNDLKVAG